MKVHSPKWPNGRPHLGRLLDAVTAWICSKGRGFLHLCVTQGTLSSEWESQPAVLSCGDSGDSLQNVKCNIPFLLATKVPFTILQIDIKTLHNFWNTHVVVTQQSWFSCIVFLVFDVTADVTIRSEHSHVTRKHHLCRWGHKMNTEKRYFLGVGAHLPSLVVWDVIAG